MNSIRTASLFTAALIRFHRRLSKLWKVLMFGSVSIVFAAGLRAQRLNDMSLEFFVEAVLFICLWLIYYEGIRFQFEDSSQDSMDDFQVITSGPAFYSLRVIDIIAVLIHPLLFSKLGIGIYEVAPSVDNFQLLLGFNAIFHTLWLIFLLVSLHNPYGNNQAFELGNIHYIAVDHLDIRARACWAIVNATFALALNQPAFREFSSTHLGMILLLFFSCFQDIALNTRFYLTKFLRVDKIVKKNE